MGISDLDRERRMVTGYKIDQQEKNALLFLGVLKEVRFQTLDE